MGGDQILDNELCPIARSLVDGAPFYAPKQKGKCSLKSMKTDTKTRILKAGARLVHTKGYLGTGIQEIAEAAKIPKGSFYFYFKSKEDFGLALIDYYRGLIEVRMDECVRDSSFPPVQRIRRFFESLVESFARNAFKGG
jgi:TetR/AcrR family transcriptional repressor of nem operon